MTKKILVVDDDKEILFAMSAICEYQGWIPIKASNVNQAIEKCKQENPDIILMDYHLPVISGIEGVKRIRGLDKDIPIIVLTVEEDQKVADRFMEVGASDFALKPIKAPDIISRINVHIRLKKTIEDSNKDQADKEDLNEELNKEDIEYTKGIAKGTLEKIIRYMNKTDSYSSINIIADGTGLAYQTVHRYLQHIENQGIVDVSYKYGKVGRPKKRYKLK